MNRDKIRDLEAKIGILSHAQKALLTTDGSVTALLEAFLNSSVTIETYLQEKKPASEMETLHLNIKPGELINHREVLIHTEKSKKPLIYAVSESVIGRMPGYALRELTRADQPIGHILKDAALESRRELLDISLNTISPQISQLLGGKKDFPLISRTYRIIHHEKPLFYITEYFLPSLFADKTTIHVNTPSRLHLGLIDMTGSMGRIDGGIGITLKEPSLSLTATRSDQWTVQGEDKKLNERIKDILISLEPSLLPFQRASIRIHQGIAGHEGLGSGTQTALAVATAVTGLYQKKMEPEELALITGRGGTSGIGVRSFIHGGVIVDGGHSFGPGREKEAFLPSSACRQIPLPPQIGRYPFPSQWKIILVTPAVDCRISGIEEKKIFSENCPVPLDETMKVTHSVMMGLIPSLINQDLDGFGSALRQIQETGFKAREIRLQSPYVRETLQFMQDMDLACGMSSFGPTLYAITDTNVEEKEASIRTYLKSEKGGTTTITSGQNHGAEISFIAP